MYFYFFDNGFEMVRYSQEEIRKDPALKKAFCEEAGRSIQEFAFNFTSRFGFLEEFGEFSEALRVIVSQARESQP